LDNSFIIDLNEFNSKKPRIIRLLILGTSFFIALSVLSLSIFLTSQSPLEWFFLIAAIYLALYVYFAWLTFKAKLFIKVNQNMFEYKFGLFKRDKNIILWDSIKKVKLGPAYITFFKKSGRRKTVGISWLPYSKVIEIKENLSTIIQKKNIVLEIGEIIKYDKKKEKEDKNKT